MGHLLLTKACLLIKHGPLHNPLRGRQTFTRQTDFATKPEMFFSIRDYFVSILYEADRLCNGRQRVNVALMFPFQSSTRQTDFATRRGVDRRHHLPAVSILYEADRLCNAGWSRISPVSWSFQSSTRQADFATIIFEDRPPLTKDVSILYEAGRLCNERLLKEGHLLGLVSILYEAGSCQDVCVSVCVRGAYRS